MPWFVACLCMASGPAIAQEATPPVDRQHDIADHAAQGEVSPAANAAVDVEEERVVCRREKTIGSNRSVRVCRSVEDIRRQQDSAQDALRSGAVSTP
ncbi:hypothetical protein E2F46_12265 [Luteimonas aestuarii]|uniref:Uncharacterized protein n=1 Tax=Luteimonas aestuarii TaxID=453837 RepID=A0A4R5TPP2_9GAMM|nr:hypothetical protein [Luteimonas aestuarii]TDK23131.1 hypothetical protein E2F46_12265 [Luteimonas aestuarii]